MRIISGYSLPGRIRLMTDMFEATATCDRKTRCISTEINRNTAAEQWAFIKRSSFHPIPKLFPMFMMIKAKFRALILVFFCTMTVSDIWMNSWAIPSKEIIHPSLLRTLAGCAFDISLFAVVIIIAGFKIAKWHGAEHMVISCYDRTNNPEPSLDDLRKETPWNPSCATRFLLPFLLMGMITSRMSHWAHIPFSLVYLLGLEVLFRIDALLGFDRIPIFSHASMFIQKYVVTNRPDNIELKTACAALRALDEAHRAELDNP
jgi:uncharacterized protein YqhQ